MMNSLPTSALFEVDAIVDAAERIAPGSQTQFAFLDGLEVLCDALEHEAGCTPEGRLATHNGLVQSLVTQARVHGQRQAHPQIAAIAIEDPVFIIGLPRTGTTLLHNLLSQHPDLRCPQLWELLQPAGGRDAAAQAAAAQQAQQYVDWYYQSAPRMPMVHPMDARRPDECQRLLGNAFRSPIFWVRYDVPSYAAWFLGQDLRAAYQFHKTQLQHILWRRPGAPLVLKDPFHIWNLDALAAVYPKARYLFLHRDPAASVVSTCGLTEVARAARSARHDPAAIGRFWLGHIESALARLPQLRRSVISPGAALDIRYSDLTADSAGTMERICDFLGVPMTDRAQANVQRFTIDNPLQKQGVHAATAEQFDLDRDDLSSRFAAYRDRYHL